MIGGVKVSVNASKLAKELARSGGVALDAAIKQEVDAAVSKAQKKALNDFKTHPVVREIRGGNSSSNLSGLLGGYGNLYSYLGFTDTEPVNSVEDKLKENIETQVKGRFFGIGRLLGRYNVEVKSPSIEDLEKVSAMEWSTQSWIDAVEHGVGGGGSMGYFWSKGKRGRSGGGVQTENDVGREAETAPFMSSILERMKERVRNAINSV
jgi:hypothetical protein